jgi:hypothetical protein
MKNWTIIALAAVAPLCGCGSNPYTDYVRDPNSLLIFHNNSGPMCLEALDWLGEMKAQHPALQVEEHLVTQPAETLLLSQIETEFSESNGVSNRFGYLPIIFYQDQAYSGFNQDVAAALQVVMEASDTGAP